MAVGVAVAVAAETVMEAGVATMRVQQLAYNKRSITLLTRFQQTTFYQKDTMAHTTWSDPPLFPSVDK